MTPDAIESEACVRNCKRRIVIVNTLSIPHLRPVPTVLRTLTVFDHDGPTIDGFRWLELVASCRRGILLLDDHRSIRNYRGRILAQEPVDDGGRVIDFYGRMDAVTDAVNKRSGVAKFFVFTPFEGSVFS